MTSRHFNLEDQDKFALLSGDYNPLHIDPITARRLMFGRPVVHGIHGLLWGLDRFFESVSEQVELTALKAEFQNPMGLEEQVDYTELERERSQGAFEMTVPNKTATMVRLTFQPRQASGDFSSELPERSEPIELNAEQVAAAKGKMPLFLHHETAQSFFPNLMRAIPTYQVAQILATTTLVGMVCPGLHSVFGGLDMKFSGEDYSADGINYRVKKYDARYSRIDMRLESPNLKGKIKSFLRPAIKQQPSVSELAATIEKGEFADRRAVVIGGSRGIGEITAKLIAAGGGEVCVTYYRGQKDAALIVDEIKAFGGSAVALQFDANHPVNLETVFGDDKPPTHLFFYSTPPIFVANQGEFNVELFDKFCKGYVDSFLATLKAAVDVESGSLRVLYPSSVALDELPLSMGEYSAAKAAGEYVCQFLSKANPELKILVPRFPRIATDQTATLMQVEETDPVPLLTKYIRELG